MLKTLTGSTASNGEGQPGQPGQPDQPIDTIDITTALSQLLPHQAAVIRKLVTDGHYTLAIQYAGCRRDCQKALVRVRPAMAILPKPSRPACHTA